MFVFVLAAAQDRASDLHRRALVLDTHADTTQQMIYEGFDLEARASQGHVDIPRMREGGLDAVFFSIWMPSTLSGPDVVKRSPPANRCRARAGAPPSPGPRARDHGGRSS